MPEASDEKEVLRKPIKALRELEPDKL